MSSRNANLTPAERQVAPAIHTALDAAADTFDRGLTDPLRLETTARSVLEGAAGLAVQYVSVVDDITLSRPDRAFPGTVLAVAVTLGSTRLIDNVVLGAERH